MILVHLDYSGQIASLGDMEIRLPPDREAHLAALAAKTGLSTGELVDEAVELWESRRAQQHQAPTRKHGPAEAVARILELRRGNNLPDGVTIKDLINYGRA